MCERKEGESFEEYKDRRWNEKLDTMIALESTVIWESKVRGPYVIKKHGKIGSDNKKSE